MSDGNSWCTCRKKLPQGYDTSGCPVHDRDQEKPESRSEIEFLYPYVNRIRRVVTYNGSDDHEDIVSILKELIRENR